MDAKKLPSADRIRALLDYNPESGSLTWKERPREDFKSVGSWKSHNTKYAGKPAFTCRMNGGFDGKIDGGLYRAHRVIWKLVTGLEPTGDIDHIDGNPYNNTWRNLRDVPRALNSKNKCRLRRTTRPYNGVFFRYNAWQAVITIDWKYQHLGSFRTVDEAIAARKRAEAGGGFHENHGRPFRQRVRQP